MSTGQNEFPPGRPMPSVPDHELLRLIGRGSYGEVWLARNIMGALRAVKVIYRGSFDDSRPYEREYAGLKRFEPISRQHPSQIDILHIGRNDTDACFYYVMELADDSRDQSRSADDFGRYQPKTLRSEMERRSPLPASECVELGLALSTALAHLHDNGLVHRDIKPSNIVFVNGLPKLADIGLVSPVDATRSYVGTVGYAPYEGPGTPQADIYSLGKVLYEASTGRDRQEFPELPTRIGVTQEEENDFLELNEVLLKACDADPHSRYQTAREMYEDLLALRSGKSLIKLRTTEKRFKRAKRVGAFLAAGILLSVAAYLYQARQTRAVTKLAQENLKLAEGARQNAEENRKRLLKLEVADATKKILKDDWTPALTGLINAMRLIKPGTAEDRTHRQRWTSIIENHPKLLHIFLHDYSVIHCAYSPDGAHIASISLAKTNYEFRIYDLASERLLLKTNVVRDPLDRGGEQTLFYSRDGRRLILRPAVPEDPLVVLDPSDGRALELPNTRWLDSVDAETALVLKDESEIQLIHLGSREVVGKRIPNTAKLLGARLNVSNTHFVALRTGSAGKEVETLEIYDLSKGTIVGPQLPAQSPHVPIGLTRDGKIVAMAEHARTQKIARFLTETGMENSLPQESGEEFLSMIQSTDGLWVVTRDKYRVGSAVRCVDTGEETRLPPPKSGAQYLFSGDGLLISLEEGIFRRSDGSLFVPQLWSGRWIHCQAFAPNGREIATGSSDNTLRIWDFSASTPPRDTIRTTDKIVDAAFSLGGEMIVSISSGNSSLRAYDTKSLRPLGPPRVDGMIYDTIRFSPDGSKVVLFNEPQIGKRDFSMYRTTGCLVADPRTESTPLHWLETDGAVMNAEFSRDSSRLLLSSPTLRRASVYDISTEQTKLSLEHSTPLIRACFAPDESIIASVAVDGLVRLWNGSTGQLIDTLNLPKPAQRIAFSPDGQNLVISCTDECLRFWRLKEHRLGEEWLYHPGIPLNVKFMPGRDKFLTTTPASSVRAWNTSGELLFPEIDTRWGVSAAEFSPDGQYLLSGTDNRVSWFCDGETGELLRFPTVQAGALYATHFSPDSNSFLTCGADMAIRVWNTEVKPISWPLADLTELVEIWSNYSVSNTTRPQLTGQEIIDRYARLRGQHPGIFSGEPREIAAWHETRAAEAKQQNLPRAVIFHLTQALRTDPELARSPTVGRIYLWRGQEYSFIEDFDNASADLERAVRIDPDDVLNWSSWCIALIGAGREAEYAAACVELVKRFAGTMENTSAPELRLRRWFLGSLVSLGKNSIPPSVGSHILDTLEPVYHEVMWHDRGLALLRLNRFDEALEAFAKMEQMASGPDHDRAKLLQSIALARLGRSKEASDRYAEGMASYKRRSIGERRETRDIVPLLAAARRQAEEAIRQCSP